MTTPDSFDQENNTQKLKDYYCPFCNHKLFRGNVKEFKMVCQECNRLVDSNNLDPVTATDDDKA